MRQAISASANNAAGANNVSLPAIPGFTAYCTGFEVTGGGATSAALIAVTLTGCESGTFNYVFSVVAGVTAGCTPLVVEFAVPVSATGPNAAITLNVPSFGTGNTNASSVIHGFYLQGLPDANVPVNVVNPAIAGTQPAAPQ